MAEVPFQPRYSPYLGSYFINVILPIYFFEIDSPADLNHERGDSLTKEVFPQLANVSLVINFKQKDIDKDRRRKSKMEKKGEEKKRMERRRKE